MTAAKYTVIKNGSTDDPTGDVIPEPCLVIRAKDAFAMRMIDHYITLTQDMVSKRMTADLGGLKSAMQDWRDGHPDQLKLPD